MIQKVLFFCLLTLLSACANNGVQPSQVKTAEAETKPESVVVSPRVIQHVKDGGITFANGENEVIKNFNDPKAIVFFIVRHCEKASDGTKNPPLTEEGEARAVRLGKVLDGVPITRIATTNLTRTIRTGEALVPYVMAAPLETFPPRATPDWLQEVLVNDLGGKFVVVGHQNTVPELINQLTGTTDYSLIPADEFGNLWIVSYSGGKADVVHCWYE